jgi:hypothetical protein
MATSSGRKKNVPAKGKQKRLYVRTRLGHSHVYIRIWVWRWNSQRPKEEGATDVFSGGFVGQAREGAWMDPRYGWHHGVEVTIIRIRVLGAII